MFMMKLYQNQKQKNIKKTKEKNNDLIDFMLNKNKFSS